MEIYPPLEDLSASGGFIRLWRIYPPLEDPAIGAPLNAFGFVFNRGLPRVPS